MVESALVLHLEGLPNLKGEDHLEGLALLYVIELEGAAFAEGCLEILLPLASFSNMDSM